MRAVAGEEPLNLAVAERPDIAPPELGGDPPTVPVGQQTDGQDESLEGWRKVARPAHQWTIEKAFQPVALEAAAPPEQARPAAAQLPADGRWWLAIGPAAERRPASADDGRLSSRPDIVRWPAALGRHEQEPRPPPGSDCGVAAAAGRHTSETGYPASAPSFARTLASLISTRELHLGLQTPLSTMRRSTYCFR